MNCTLQQSWRHSNQSVSDDPGAIHSDDPGAIHTISSVTRIAPSNNDFKSCRNPSLRGPLNFNHLFHEEAPFRFRTCWRRPGLPGFV